MSFLSFLINYKYVLLFYTSVALIVYFNRKKFDVEAKFIYLYRTKFGLKLIDSIARHKKTIIAIGKLSAFVGFLGVFYVIWLLIKRLIVVLTNPNALGVAPVLPGLPIAGTGINFPLVIGWISLFIIIVIHEFSHGVMAKAHNIKVKSSGIAFFGPILAAFVEPDEKRLIKQKPIVQNSVFSAGPIANIVTSFLFFLILGYLIAPAVKGITEIRGIEISPINETPAHYAGLPNSSVLIGINNVTITTIEQLQNITKQIKPNTTVTLNLASNKSIKVIATKHPENASRGYIGIKFLKVIEKPKFNTLGYRIAYRILNWLSDLFFWLYFISLNLGLINLFPIFITDGARIIQSIMLKYFKDEKRAIKWWKLANEICLFILLLLIFVPWIKKLLAVL